MSKDGNINSLAITPWDLVATRYSNEIISPFLHDPNMTLMNKIHKIPRNKRVNAIDLGCGVGNAFKYLKGPYSKVTALDISKGMLKEAKKQLFINDPDNYKKFNFICSPIHELSPYHHKKYNLVLSINSLVFTDRMLLKKSFKKLQNLLAPGGRAFIVLPSLNSVIEQYQYTLDYYLSKKMSEKTALLKTDKDFEHSRIDFKLGHYNTGDMLQKYYYTQEIAGFLDQTHPYKISQIHYEKGINYHYGLPPKNIPNMWDHLISMKADE